MARPRIVCVQSDWTTNAEENVSKMETLVRRLHSEWGKGISLVTFCELAVTGFDPVTMREDAQTIPGPATERLQALAVATGYYICNGSMLERDGERIYNTTVICSPEGGIVHKYRKTHPWAPPYGGEDVSWGETFPVTEIPGLGKVGTMTCSDGYLPEVARALAYNGAEIILWNAMTFEPLTATSRAIAQARAMENQCYIVMCVGSGTHVGLGLHGHSMIVNPDGVITAETGTGPSFLMDVIDPQAARVARNEGSHGVFSAFIYLRQFGHKYPQYSGDVGKGPVYESIDI